MFQTWLRDAVLAGMIVLSIAFAMEHTSEIQTTTRKFIRDAQAAPTPPRAAPRSVQKAVASTPLKHPSPMSAPVRHPPAPNARATTTRRITSVRIVPRSATVPYENFPSCLDRIEPACRRRWVPVAACQDW